MVETECTRYRNKQQWEMLQPKVHTLIFYVEIDVCRSQDLAFVVIIKAADLEGNSLCMELEYVSVFVFAYPHRGPSSAVPSAPRRELRSV